MPRQQLDKCDLAKFDASLCYGLKEAREDKILKVFSGDIDII